VLALLNVAVALSLSGADGVLVVRCQGRERYRAPETRIKHGHISIYQSIYLSVCLSINLSIYLSIYLSICLSVYLSIYLSIHPSIHPSIYQPIQLSFYPSIHLCIIARSVLFAGISESPKNKSVAALVGTSQTDYADVAAGAALRMY
jgi:hypothetical protein